MQPRLVLQDFRQLPPRPAMPGQDGIQPRMSRIRERLGYSSRFTKMLMGLRALTSVDPAMANAKIDLSKTFTNKFVEAAAKTN